MRLFAEEKRQGTIELLATAPITDLQIVLGKFLAAVGLYGLMILAGLLNLALIWHYASTPPEWKPVLTGALALLLFGSCFIALGVFVSTSPATRSWPASSPSASSWACGPWVGRGPVGGARDAGNRVPRRHHPHGGPGQGGGGPEGRRLLPELIAFGLFLATNRCRASGGGRDAEGDRLSRSPRDRDHRRVHRVAAHRTHAAGKARAYLIAGAALVLAHLLLRWDEISKLVGRRQMKHGRTPRCWCSSSSPSSAPSTTLVSRHTKRWT